MAGRRTKYTPETVDRILQGVRLGMTDRLTCAYAVIETTTFYRWMQDKKEFRDAVTRTEAQLAAATMAIVRNAALGDKESGTPPDWRAAAKLNEMRFPKDFGRQAIEISGPDGGAIVIKGYTTVTPDD
jgi:hypothetical protein